jgi:hypothetical protein
MIAEDLPNKLAIHPNFIRREGMVFKNGALDLEHPNTLGWLFCLMMRMAPRTVVKPKKILLRTVQLDGKFREFTVRIHRDDDGFRLVGHAITEAILTMWERNWDMVFDDPLSAHSLGAAFLALEHY